VCIAVGGVATCAATDELGRYTFSVPKTDEPGLLTVTHADFATTTMVSLFTDVSHSLGVMPRSTMPATSGASVVLVRSFVYVEQYIMTAVGPGAEVDITIGEQRAHVTTGRDGFAMFETGAAGEITIAAMMSGVSCGVWGGNVTSAEPAAASTSPDGVTEVDVICWADARG
jgi:hypothetical protein